MAATRTEFVVFRKPQKMALTQFLRRAIKTLHVKSGPPENLIAVEAVLATAHQKKQAVWVGSGRFGRFALLAGEQQFKGKRGKRQVERGERLK